MVKCASNSSHFRSYCLNSLAGGTVVEPYIPVRLGKKSAGFFCWFISLGLG